MAQTFRDIRRKARLEVHRRFQVICVYTLPGEAPRKYFIRVHNKVVSSGDMNSPSAGYAGIVENQPTAVFLLQDVRPVRGAMLSISSDEAYAVDTVLPDDDGLVSALLIPLDSIAAGQLRLPDDVIEADSLHVVSPFSGESAGQVT